MYIKNNDIELVLALLTWYVVCRILFKKFNNHGSHLKRIYMKTYISTRFLYLHQALVFVFALVGSLLDGVDLSDLFLLVSTGLWLWMPMVIKFENLMFKRVNQLNPTQDNAVKK